MKISGVEFSEQLKLLGAGAEPAPKILDEGGSAGGQKVSFTDFLEKQFSEVNHAGVEAENAIQRSLTGDELNPHATLIAVQKASISLTLMMSIKERLERTYQELIRMPIG